jgi:hypothetical protein
MNPHDTVVMCADAKTQRIKATILHYSFDTPVEFSRQSERFAALAALAMFEKGKTVTPVMLLLKTGWAFMHSYLIKAGFLDGKAGWIIARVIAASTYDKYRRLRRSTVNGERSTGDKRVRAIDRCP